MQFLLTLLVATAFGALFYKLKIPAGIMVGSVFGAALLGITMDLAYMPLAGKFVAQAIAGTYIATTVKKEDFVALKSAIKPAIMVLTALLALTAIMGLLIHSVTEMDLLTACMSAVPGGITDVTIISADMGADGGQVAVLQFVRLLMGIGIFPGLIAYVCRNEPSDAPSERSKKEKIETNWKKTAITVGVGLLGGAAGWLSNIPAGTLVGALLAVIGYGLRTGQAAVPMSIKRLAQMMAGAYIGSGIGMKDVLQMKILFVPAVILVTGYTLNCFFMSYLLQKFCGFGKREAMLTATPGGASDMALIASDLGVFSPKLLVLQIFRMMMAVLVFPQFVRLIVAVFG